MAAASGALERVNRSKKRLVGEARSPSRNDEYLLYQTLLGTWPLEPLDPGRLAGFGLLNSLSQVLLKLTVPGVPDIYQGNELWAFNLVDPDNRRPVDYRHRQALLETLDASCRDRDSLPALLRELLDGIADGRAKLYITWKTLSLRSTHARLFAEGQYLELPSEGPRADHVCAFARRCEDNEALVVAPRWFARLGADGGKLTDSGAVWGASG